MVRFYVPSYIGNKKLQEWGKIWSSKWQGAGTRIFSHEKGGGQTQFHDKHCVSLFALDVSRIAAYYEGNVARQETCMGTVSQLGIIPQIGSSR